MSLLKTIESSLKSDLMEDEARDYHKNMYLLHKNTDPTTARYHLKEIGRIDQANRENDEDYRVAAYHRYKRDEPNKAINYYNEMDIASKKKLIGEGDDIFHLNMAKASTGDKAIHHKTLHTLLTDLKNSDDGQVYTSDENYKGGHEAPDALSGAPLHNLKDVYPDDIYIHGASHYGSGVPSEYESMSILHSVKGKPNKLVKVYRAIPNNLTSKDRAKVIEKKMKYMMDYHKLPKDANPADSWDTHYNRLKQEHENILATADENEKPIKINAGDWVTGSKTYAMNHGRDNLRNEFKVISKTVPAKHLYTDGNSLDEWGYSPS